MKYSFSMLSRITFFAVLLASSSVANISFASFSDSGGREDTKAIEFLQMNGIVEGYDSGDGNTQGIEYLQKKGIISQNIPTREYRPEQNISRAEFTKILMKTAQAPTKRCNKTDIKEISQIFSDVNSSDWFAEYICNAYNSGFIKGYSDGTFKPHQEINLAEAAKIVILSQGINIDETDNGEWYQKYLEALEKEKALNKKLISGNNTPINRGLMADLVWRLQTGNEIYETDEPQEIGNCLTLKDQLKKAQKRQNGRIMFKGEIDLIQSSGGNEVVNFQKSLAPQDGTNSISMEDKFSNDFSTTNIQEKGVDEADIIKNDGSHIFYARGSDLRIVKAYPLGEMKEEAKIEIEGMNISELFLEQDILIALGNRSYDYNNFNNMIIRKPSSSSYYGGGNNIEVRIFDISDRKNPKQIRSVSLDGNLISSRRVGETLYLISNKYVNTYDENLQLPILRDIHGSIDQKYDVAPKCGNITYFPNFSSSNLTTITAVNIKNPQTKISMKNFLGAGNNIYSSPENLYIVQSDNQQVFSDENGVAQWNWEDISKIFKFSIDGQNINFVAKGKVNGRVLNQYSMSEYDNYFRIATHRNGNWRNGRNNSENIVSILDENLETTGEITGIAKGENIKSVRFMGKRGFVVTFKSVDPLFVIDMDPENPQIVGELKIPGWSDYLHPIDENYIIGFGKEVNPESENKERLTWDMLMGMKISIFDVSDLENPKEIHKTVIGDRGTESDILRNPKSLFFDAQRQLVGFPVLINTQTYNDTSCIPTSEDIPCIPSHRYDKYKNTFQGAYLYHFDIEKGFTLQGAITHFPKFTNNFWDRDSKIQRLVRIGEQMYSVSHGMMKGLNMNLKEEKIISFNGTLKCEEITTSNLCATRNDCEIEWEKPFCPNGKSCVQIAEFSRCLSR